jgi:hypothetical protein
MTLVTCLFVCLFVCLLLSVALNFVQNLTNRDKRDEGQQTRALSQGCGARVFKRMSSANTPTSSSATSRGTSSETTPGVTVTAGGSGVEEEEDNTVKVISMTPILEADDWSS